jgi:hypothetical protein
MNLYWKFGFLIAVACLHAAQVVVFWFSGDRPAFVILLGFTIADVGLIWALQPNSAFP